MSKAKERATLPEMELIPREERDQEEIRYRGYTEKIYNREVSVCGK